MPKIKNSVMLSSDIKYNQILKHHNGNNEKINGKSHSEYINNNTFLKSKQLINQKKEIDNNNDISIKIKVVRTETEQSEKARAFKANKNIVK